MVLLRLNLVMGMKMQVIQVSFVQKKIFPFLLM